ncbi:MAG: LysR family transcriptional regulator [Psychromonas sp.]|nr:LysR family transcriptional regulator [Psychromonas sp.]
MPQNRHFDLNLLRVFMTVADQGSFTKAAESLDLTQSSVSNAINRLKESLGENLFVREGRGIKLTSYGRQLFSELQPSVLQIDQVLNAFSEFDIKETPRIFHVYCIEPLVHELQRKISEKLKNSVVSVVFHELFDDQDVLLANLRAEKIDLIIDISPPTGVAFNFEKVTELELCCVASKDHPRIQNTLSKKQYFSEYHAFSNIKRANQRVADYLSQDFFLERKIHSEHGSTLGILAAVSESEALGLCTRAYAEKYEHVFNLQVLKSAIHTKNIDIFMISTQKMKKNSANLWLKAMLRDSIKNKFL